MRDLGIFSDFEQEMIEIPLRIGEGIAHAPASWCEIEIPHRDRVELVTDPLDRSLSCRRHDRGHPARPWPLGRSGGVAPLESLGVGGDRPHRRHKNRFFPFLDCTVLFPPFRHVFYYLIR